MKKLKTFLILWAFIVIVLYVSDKYFNIDILNIKGQSEAVLNHFKGLVV